MIKYHGTPVGGKNLDAVKFLSGRHALISFAYQDQVAEVLDCCESFCLDNGAFTIWKTTGGSIDIPAYKAFVDSLGSHPAFDFCLIPDIIMGGAEANDALINEWESKYVSVPVYHLGEPYERFLSLAARFNKVALGSTDLWGRTGTKEWWAFMADFMDAVTDDNGVLPCKVHGLRMLDVKIFQYLPLHSGDSTNAGVNGHRCMTKGVYPALERWQGNERIAQRIEAFQSAHVWDRERLVEAGVLEK